MDVSRESAEESLTVMENIMDQTRKAIASSHASSYLILWGLIWGIAFIGCHFYPLWSGWIWIALDVAGIIASMWIYRKGQEKAPIRFPGVREVGRRFFLFIPLLFLYILLWLMILSPFTGIQCCAFICTVVMFAYVLFGMFSGNSFLLWVGLAVTAFIGLGFFLFADYFYLWMAPTGGGALLGTGLYIRFCWR